MKTALLLMLTGALVGAAVASLIVPAMLSWYAPPAGLSQDAPISTVQVRDVIRYATSRLIWWQMIGAGAGAVVALVLPRLARRSRRPAAAGTAVPPSRPTGQP